MCFLKLIFVLKYIKIIFLIRFLFILILVYQNHQKTLKKILI
jgi:hypothetical protein